ncbi:hypothetical protein MCOR31_011916 [Pyricularia oryzae]|uniref:Uncharacterized protein n=1 Tax=Pyricularia grisea TaxID=148305 RepID=A0ABQ8N2A7_PYRGI|nr:hypothetical protein MCOR26_001375 [Pyricularia oryzae]KAI6290038.1 hypothetical protein MCOR33_011569 [Pyricularia grisea]KAI6341864.1 hypothetical protein MCOR28_005728 [Pyricularia oryzae]KAI6352122.1 hypothetical protein MCOR31_011916 [Pyricularia oryzae]KAI6419826.1 hypothetical protein MCOR24_004912 [Pyricularia oryzae]
MSAGTTGDISAAPSAEIYDTDRFGELYYASRDIPTQNLGLAGRYLTSVFKKYEIQFAFLGGWAMYLRGSRRTTEDLDLTINYSIEDLKQILLPEPRQVSLANE